MRIEKGVEVRLRGGRKVCRVRSVRPDRDLDAVVASRACDGTEATSWGSYAGHFGAGAWTKYGSGAAAYPECRKCADWWARWRASEAGR